MSELERVLRLLGGLAGTPLVYLLAVRPLDGWLELLLIVVLISAAIDLVVTGIRGYCPAYRYVAVPWAEGASATRWTTQAPRDKQSAASDEQQRTAVPEVKSPR